MKKRNFNENLSQLSVELGGYVNGRAAATRKKSIYLLEQQSVPGFVPYLKIYPLLTQLRKNKDFVYACINHFVKGHTDAFLADLCKWFAGQTNNCPVSNFDLFDIPGDFHKEIVFFDDDKSMSRKKLIASIENKFHDGYVLDHTKMTCDRIAYKNDEYDSIIGEYLPCLVTNDDDEVAVDYFEKDDFTSLAEQVGITSSSEYTLDFIQTPYLHHILYSMVKP